MIPARDGTSRRAVLGIAAAATGTALMEAAFAGTSPSGGIDAVWAMWKTTMTRLNHHAGSLTEEIADKLCSRLIDLENRMLAWPEPSPRKTAICLWLALDHLTTMIWEKDAISREDWRWIADRGEAENGATRCVVQGLCALYEGDAA